MIADGQFLTPRYQIVRQLGKGGMGVIYEAFDTLLQTTVAIKENLLPHESMRLAFQREAQLLANLHHPSLPTCIELVVIEGTQYMVLEFIDGENLETIMSSSKEPLTCETVLDWGRQLLDVIEYLHAEMVLHRDIKPANIKILNGRLYLLDFGLAYGQCGEMNTITPSEFNWDCYSQKYSSIEQLRGERTNFPSDLYSIAATLYRLLTYVPGIPSERFDAEYRLQRITKGESDPLKGIARPDLDDDASRTIIQALSIWMDDRPQSAAEMKQLMFPKRVRKVENTKTYRKYRFVGIHALLSILLIAVIVVGATSPSRVTKCENQTSTEVNRSPSASQLGAEAEQLWLNGKYEAALTKIDQAIVLDDSIAHLHFIRGEILWDLDELSTPVAEMEGVLAAARKVISLLPSPQTSEERTARAWAYLALSKSDEALSDINVALTQKPNSSIALLIRTAAEVTNVKLKRVRIEEIAAQLLADCNRATELTPNYPAAYAIQAEILTGLNQPKSARDAFEKAVSLRDQASFHSKLGNIYFQLDELDQARSHQQKAIKKNPQYFEAYLSLGDILFKQKDWSKAADNYLLANRIFPTTSGLLKLGEAYELADQTQAAISSYQRALRSAPNNTELKNRLAHAQAKLNDSHEVD